MLNFKEFARQQINEIGDQPYKFTRTIDDEEDEDGNVYDGYVYAFKTDDGRPVHIHINLPNEPRGADERSSLEWSILFIVNGSLKITGEGDAFRILTTVLAVLEDWYKLEPNATRLCFSADRGKDGKESRVSLYRRISNKFAQKYGFRVREEDHVSSVYFYLKK